MKNEIRCFKMVGVSIEAQESVEKGDGKYCKVQTFHPRGSSTQYAIELSNPTSEISEEDKDNTITEILWDECNKKGDLLDKAIFNDGVSIEAINNIFAKAAQRIEVKISHPTPEISDWDRLTKIEKLFNKHKVHKDELIEFGLGLGDFLRATKNLSHPTPDREELVSRLASMYKKDRLMVATICDEVLDRTGALLGDVRKAARKYNKPSMDANEYLLTREIKDGDTTASVMEEYLQLKLKEGAKTISKEDVDKLWKNHSKITKRGYTVYETMTLENFEAAIKEHNDE